MDFVSAAPQTLWNPQGGPSISHVDALEYHDAPGRSSTEVMIAGYAAPVTNQTHT